MKSIVEAVATIDERFELVDFLDELKAIIYMPNFDKKLVLDHIPSRASKIVSEILTEALPKGTKNVVKALEKAKDDLENMPIVVMAIPIEPNEKLAWMIKNWFLEKNGQNVLISFTIDKSLIGGAIIESGGFRSEFSFKKYFETGKDKN